MGLKVLGTVGKQIVLIIYFFWKKNMILCILKGELVFQNASSHIFSENLKNVLGFTVNLGRVGLP